MKYRSLEHSIKHVVHGLAEKSGYKNLQHSIRSVMEAKKDKNFVENDPRDQIVAGTYKTKNFEQSPEAQKLYAKLPDKKYNMDDLQKSAELHDKLFDLHKDVIAKSRSTEADVGAAKEIADKIKLLAKSLDLEKEHNYIDRILKDFDTHLDTTGNIVNAKDLDIEKLNSRFASPPKDVTKEPPDRDIDNDRFKISRNLKAQRKLKIIDAD